MRKRIETLESFLEKENKRSEKERADHQKSLVEPLWYLKSIPYAQYRTSHHWKNRSEAFRAEVVRESLFPKCDLCGIEAMFDTDGITTLDWVPQFHVHHVSYENIGCERDQDLRLLCSACHNLVHFPDSNAARFWADYNSVDQPDLKIRALALKPVKSSFFEDLEVER